MRDRSLDEFLDAGGDATEGTGTDGDGADGTADASAPVTDPEPPDAERGVEPAIRRVPDGPAVEPAASTYAFVPDGAPCAACGARVERRWRDEDGLVCGDCKAW